MNDRAFLDTNVLIYALARGDPRVTRAQELLAQRGVVSVQILNEFVSVALRKIRMPWKDMMEALDAIRILCPSVVPIAVETHEVALRIAHKYGYGIYDALVAAAALEAGCVTLYSEDLQDGQRIDNRLTIRNPFQ
jgi:predicted nucleic acid-binding protein